MQELALRAALVHRGPRAFDACDALGAHGSKLASMHDGRLCEVCDTILLSSHLLRMFSVQSFLLFVFRVVLSDNFECSFAFVLYFPIILGARFASFVIQSLMQCRVSWAGRRCARAGASPLW